VAPTPSESLSEVRAGVLRRPGLVCADLRDALTDAYDAWLRARLGDRADVALVAVGGLGRREPAPFSDLDLVLLYSGRVDGLAELADSIWYPIWDSGIGLDHSVRTPAQAVDVAKDDLKAVLGLLDVRHVAGDESLSSELRARVVDLWRSTAGKRVEELRDISETRWANSGEAAFLLEPNVKDSRGALRDVQALHALALAQLVDLPIPVRAANTVFLDVRGELHRVTGRDQDELRLQEHDAVAAALGLRTDDGEADRDAVLRRVNLAARTVAHALDVTWHKVGVTTARRPLRQRLLGGSGPVREGIARDVVAQDGEVVLARDAAPRTDPGLVLRAARAAAENELPFASFTLARLADEAAPVPDPWTSAMRTDFVALLGTGQAAIPVLEALDLAGLLEPLLPEWATVRCRAQHNPVHRYTVDRHLMETAARADEHTRDVDRPDLLLVGALLHDIGKGYPGDHSIVGAERARVIATRMGFDDADVDVIVALVRHHLLLPDTATRRDLDDPMTVALVRDEAGSSLVLSMLHALSIADAAATGPGAWSEWKGRLIDDLVRRAQAVLDGGALPAPAPLDDERRALAAEGRLAVVIREDEVVVAAPDAPGVLYRTAGVLALHSLDVHAASIATQDGMAVNSFVVSPRFGELPDAALVRADLARAVEGTLGLADRLREKERTYARRGSQPRRPPRVSWFDDEATDATIVEIRAEDSIGLLCRVTAALERSGLDVSSAIVSSLGGSVVDSFYVTKGGRKVPEADRRDIEIELRTV